MDFNKYIIIINNISEKYNYPNNIKHLLYVIVPAFIIKYGSKNESLILKCISEIPIEITKKEDNMISACYISNPYKDNKIKTKKTILLNIYDNINFLQLIDNLIHEINHALNSINKEIIISNDDFYLRTGLCKTKYNNFKIVEKDRSFVLEEIINSKQTETIIDIIKNLESDNIEIQNTLYAIKKSIKKNYISPSYFCLKHYCSVLLNNKTFLLTLENLRLTGNIDNIVDWFDSIYGKGGYKLLVDTLYEFYNLSKKKKMFKKRKLKKLALKLIGISDRFNNVCTIK